jgi:hypothetical protein
MDRGRSYGDLAVRDARWSEGVEVGIGDLFEKVKIDLGIKAAAPRTNLKTRSRSDEEQRYGLKSSSDALSRFRNSGNVKGKVSSIAPVRVWATLSASNANGGTSPMVAHDENSHDIANNTKQEVIREALQIHAAEIALANGEGFWPLGSLLHAISQLGVEFVGELPRRNHHNNPMISSISE